MTALRVFAIEVWRRLEIDEGASPFVGVHARRIGITGEHGGRSVDGRRHNNIRRVAMTDFGQFRRIASLSPWKRPEIARDTIRPSFTTLSPSMIFLASVSGAA